MKSVLISIRPKWCEKIANREKTIEVRKTAPKLEPPFKCYMYCTKPKYDYEDYIVVFDKPASFFAGGKVIGEFVCDEIESFTTDYRMNEEQTNRIAKQSCLNMVELMEYEGNSPCLFGWHISDLFIYDEPKKLSEFAVVDEEAVKQCECRERIYNSPAHTNGAYLLGSYICSDTDDWCIKCITKPVKRPPQSWCYVQECDT